MDDQQNATQDDRQKNGGTVHVRLQYTGALSKSGRYR